MFAYMDTNTLIVVGLAIAVSAFFAGAAMHGVMEDDGFGPVGNMIIMIAGAIVGLYLGPMFEWPIDRNSADAVAAVSGGFIALAVLAIIKSYLVKLGL
ncbi:MULTISPECIES: hypothetical protein [unclassified Roseitalea]|uniref:hypothetical protein n=1 Tax=unclassified Roseitalea TaxID=2639107 RepID=UPI00273E11E4|nr:MULTISPECIES: hypothetical protein [unclassified Roseitalea]